MIYQVFLAGALLVGGANVASPVTGGSELPHSKTQIRARVEVVGVEVSVTDARGRFVGNLQRENFRVLDEGTEQPLTHFSPVESPARVLLLVEAGPAVLLLQRQHLAAALVFLEGLAADDWVALASYDAAPQLLLPFTQDKAVAARAVSSASFGLGMAELRLHESLSLALDWLAPIEGKKSILLLSTGLDTGPPEALEALLEKLRGSDVMVMGVGLGGELRQFEPQRKPAGETPPGALSFEQADRALEQIAATSGGRAYFPATGKEFAGIYREIAATLRHQYSLGFAPAARDGSYRRIEIQVVDERGRVLAPATGRSAWRVRARPGYTAPGPE